MTQSFVYGTSNAGKIQFMREVFEPLGFRLIGIGELSVNLPVVDESGNSPLENASIKALAYYKALREQTDFDYPVFSCDSGLYIEGLSEAEQPGVHVRRVGGKNLTDEEMIAYYASVAERLGGKATARYRNAICLVVNENEIYEHMGDDIASATFWLASKPHPKRESGFPLNSLSVHIESGQYYNDLEIKPRNDSQEGFRTFFRQVMVRRDTLYRPMTFADIDAICAQFAAQDSNRPREVLECYWREQENGERIVVVAEVAGEVAGYVTLFPQVKDAPPFRGRNIPEVKDFNVFQKFQRMGIGKGLMDRIEAAATEIADTVCLGVGLHSGYGSAQRMYVKRGYIPDGSGVWDGNAPAAPYGMVENGDDLVLYMSKKLR